MAVVTIGNLLLGHPDADSERSNLILPADVASSVHSLLGNLTGDWAKLRIACKEWGILQKQDGQELSAEATRDEIRGLILSWRATDRVCTDFADYCEALVAA